MIHTAFIYIPVNFAFNLPHYVTSYIHRTGEKESYNQLASRGFEPGPSESVRTKSERLYSPQHIHKFKDRFQGKARLLVAKSHAFSGIEKNYTRLRC